MWSNKKSQTLQAADPEPKNWQTTQPPAGATARLGSSLHVKGEISGNENLTLTEQLKDWSISKSGS
jgi:hypothetical protein